MSKLIVEAITEYYGERCPDFDTDCFCCKVWGEYDALTTPAPCDELETVGWLWEYAQYRTDERGYYGYETVITENNPTDHVSPAEKLRNIRELVTRQNAEEVIAAKDARIAELEADNKRLREALERITDWPNGGKNYGQEYIKHFARAALGEVKP